MRRDYFEQFNFQLFETDGSPTQQSTNNEFSSKPEPLVIPINVLILPYYPIWHKQIMLSLSFYCFDVSPNLWMWLKLISTRWLRSSRHWSRGSLLINMSVTIYQSTINICLRDYRSTGWIKIRENFNLNSVKIYFSIIQEESLEINYDIYLLHYSYSIMPTDFFDCILSF